MKVMGIGRRYKNIKRYKEISKILAKYGFGIIVDKMGTLGTLKNSLFRGASKIEKNYTRAERIRMAIEELGPTFVKLGQILSTRYDILPTDIVEELSKLQDKVNEFDLDTAKKILTVELGMEVDEVFKSFNEKPIAAASIGQVYSCILKNGDEVVVKIQRPNIQNVIEMDIDILFTIARLIDDHFNKQSTIKAVDIINEFSYMIRKELDYTYEAQNCETFRKSFKDNGIVVIPKVYWEHTTKKVLVMEKINGVKVSNIKEIENRGFNKENLAKIGAKVFMEQIFIHGFFHGDPHPGNILIVDNNKIGFIDFGIVGFIDNKILNFIITVFKYGIEKDLDKIIENLTIIGAVTDNTDISSLKRDLYFLMNYYFNIPINKISFSEAFTEILIIANRHKLKLPSQLILLIKAIATIEGTGRRLNPSFNLSTISKDIFIDISKKKFVPKDLVKSAVGISKESIKDFKDIPKKVNSILNKVEQNQLKFMMKLEGIKQLEKEINIMTNRISLSLLVSSLIVGFSIILQAKIEPKIWDISIIGLLGFIISAILGISLIISIISNWKSNRG